MKIQVPTWARAEFWDEPPADSMEFWAFRFQPKCKIGDIIEFYFDKTKVAEARVYDIERPGVTKCEHSGKFGSRWKVFWLPETFTDLRAEK